jgi:hypothetical protein
MDGCHLPPAAAAVRTLPLTRPEAPVRAMSLLLGSLSCSYRRRTRARKGFIQRLVRAKPSP